MVKSSELIGELLKLKQEIERKGPSPRFDAVYKILSTIVKVVEMELKHRELQAKYSGVHVNFFDQDVSPDSVTREDVRHIREARKEVRLAIAERKKTHG